MAPKAKEGVVVTITRKAKHRVQARVVFVMSTSAAISKDFSAERGALAPVSAQTTGGLRPRSPNESLRYQVTAHFTFAHNINGPIAR